MPTDFSMEKEKAPAEGVSAARVGDGGGEHTDGAPARGQSAEVRRAIGGESQSTFIDKLFARIDSSGDKGIDRNEVIAHLKRVGVEGGFLGLVHKKAADAFLEHLDTNKDKRVTMAEFRSVAEQILPKDVFDERGQVKQDLIDAAYKRMDANSDGTVDAKEMHAAALSELPKDASFKETTADVAAKLAIDALDFDSSGGISRAELLKAAEDAVQALKRG